MCGLFGWSLATNVPQSAVRRAYRVLSYSNDFRGGHSFGAYMADSQKIARGLGKMSRAHWTKCQAPADCSRVLCHTRFATHGNVNVSNAHPFRVGQIVGAHNGIIYNHEELNTKYDRTYQVDSQHIFAHLSEGRSLDDLQGYGAITYVNMDEPKRVYLGRFCLGELAVARLTDGRGIVWSSDADHIKAALRSAGWTYELIKIEDGCLYQVEGTEIYSTESKLNVSFGMSNKVTWWEHEYGDDSEAHTYSYKDEDDPEDVDAMSEDDWRKYMLDEDEHNFYRGEGG